MSKQLAPSEQLAYSTARIECEYANGSLGTGTGFFYTIDLPDEQIIPLLITNRHVVEHATAVRFIMTVADGNGNPRDKNYITIQIGSYSKNWILHPDDNVDLCAYPLIFLYNELRKRNQRYFHCDLDSSLIPTQAESNSLVAMEEVVMVGYPKGIWDSTNNQPIFRRGITATHPAKNYRGESEFLIDIACYPGSSGSPVFLLNFNGQTPREGHVLLKEHIRFLGVLYAGPTYTSQGEIKIYEIPTVQKAVAELQQFLNLGIILKSERVRELERTVIELNAPLQGA